MPVGDPPTGTSKGALRNRPWSLVGDLLSIPSGKLPDGTGQWPVLPETQFPNTLLEKLSKKQEKRWSSYGVALSTQAWLENSKHVPPVERGK